MRYVLQNEQGEYLRSRLTSPTETIITTTSDTIQALKFSDKLAAKEYQNKHNLKQFIIKSTK